MNVYDDYENYIEEHETLINLIKEGCPILNQMLVSIIKVLDLIYEKYVAKETIDETFDEVFDLGFSYFSNIVDDLEIYYNDYFSSNFELFNSYSQIIHYDLYLEDLRCILEEDGELTTIKKEGIEAIQETINDLLINHKKLNGNEIKTFDEMLSKVVPPSYEYIPTSYVFYMMCEELELY